MTEMKILIHGNFYYFIVNYLCDHVMYLFRIYLYGGMTPATHLGTLSLPVQGKR